MIVLGLILGALFVTPLVCVYVAVIRWCDRFEPEPWYLLAFAFIWGALVSTLAGGFASQAVLDIVAKAVHMEADSSPMHAFAATVLAPVFEEGFKAIGVALIASLALIGKKHLDGPLDGAIYGGIVGLGFTLTEDILYVSRQFTDAGITGFAVLLIVRTVMLGLSHCTFTACTGLGFGIAAASNKRSTKVVAPVVGFGAAMLMHGVHNGLPTLGGGIGTAVMILGAWVINLLYFAILGALVTQERRVIIRELLDEVGPLLSAKELPLLTSYVRLGQRNFLYLWRRGPRAYRLLRQKQDALIALAFVKARKRGAPGVASYRDTPESLTTDEMRLRTVITFATKSGVVIE